MSSLDTVTISHLIKLTSRSVLKSRRVPSSFPFFLPDRALSLSRSATPQLALEYSVYRFIHSDSEALW